MKAWACTVLGSAAMVLLALRDEPAPPRPPAAPVVAPAPPTPPHTSQATVAQGFADVGAVFQRGAGNAAPQPDRLAQAQARAAAQADDAATTRADTVPPDAPREQ